jgi:hypothetical protein
VSFAFEASRGLVIVAAELFGPAGSAVLRLALDTGATTTLINAGHFVAVGYEPSLAADRGPGTSPVSNPESHTAAQRRH